MNVILTTGLVWAQIHDVEFCASLEQIVKFTIPALLQLKAEGKVRYIGLTGYSLDTMARLVSLLAPDTVNTILTYCRCTLVDQALLEVLQFFKDRNIGVINASPVSMGLLTHRGPPAWHPATENIKCDLLPFSPHQHCLLTFSLAGTSVGRPLCTVRNKERISQIWQYFGA